MRVVDIQLLQITHVQHPTQTASELIAGTDDMNLWQYNTHDTQKYLISVTELVNSVTQEKLTVCMMSK